MDKFRILAHTMGEEAAREALRSKRAEDITCLCDKCKGTGTFRWGAVVNNKPLYSGPCFRCGASGTMSFADMARCLAYDDNRTRRLLS